MFLAEDRTLCSLVRHRICSQTIWLNVLFSRQNYSAGFDVPLGERNLVGVFNLLHKAMYFILEY